MHGKEVSLASYLKLKEKAQYSEELLEQILQGISMQKYEETVANAAGAFGGSVSSVTRRVVEMSNRKLKGFCERSLSDFNPFTVFFDAIHRVGEASIVSLGIDLSGQKQALGFWEGPGSQGNELEP